MYFKMFIISLNLFWFCWNLYLLYILSFLEKGGKGILKKKTKPLPFVLVQLARRLLSPLLSLTLWHVGPTWDKHLLSQAFGLRWLSSCDSHTSARHTATRSCITIAPMSSFASCLSPMPGHNSLYLRSWLPTSSLSVRVALRLVAPSPSGIDGTPTRVLEPARFPFPGGGPSRRFFSPCSSRYFVVINGVTVLCSWHRSIFPCSPINRASKLSFVPPLAARPALALLLALLLAC